MVQTEAKAFDYHVAKLQSTIAVLTIIFYCILRHNPLASQTILKG